MNADKIVRALRCVQEKHRNDRLLTFQTDVSAMARDAADLIESLQAQLAESQRRADAAVEDLKKHRKYKCDCCYYADKQGRYIPCRDCQSPISNYGDGWQWRGPQEAGEGSSNGTE